MVGVQGTTVQHSSFLAIARLNVLYHLGTGWEYHTQQVAGVKIVKNSEP